MGGARLIDFDVGLIEYKMSSHDRCHLYAYSLITSGAAHSQCT